MNKQTNKQIAGGQNWFELVGDPFIHSLRESSRVESSRLQQSDSQLLLLLLWYVVLDVGDRIESTHRIGRNCMYDRIIEPNRIEPNRIQQIGCDAMRCDTVPGIEENRRGKDMTRSILMTTRLNYSVALC